MVEPFIWSHEHLAWSDAPFVWSNEHLAWSHGPLMSSPEPFMWSKVDNNPVILKGSSTVHSVTSRP